jgi:large subunit ribosomal protein L25
MDSIQLVAETREASNKGAARQVRRNGRIPAVLYGEGDPKSVSVDAKEWTTRFRYVTSNTIVSLKIGGDEQDVLVKDTQEDILSGRVNHIDFYAIKAGQKLQTQIPVHLEGIPRGVREGGILEHKIEELEVVCLPKDLPASFTIDISDLGIGDSMHVGDIEIPEGIEVRTETDLTLVVVTHPKAVVEDEEAEAMEEGIEAEASSEGDAAEGSAEE